MVAQQGACCHELYAMNYTIGHAFFRRGGSCCPPVGEVNHTLHGVPASKRSENHTPAPVYVTMTSGAGGGYDAVFTRNVPGVSSGDTLCNPTTPSEQPVRKARSIRNRDDSATLCETVTTVPGPVLCVVMVQELLGWNVTLHTLIAPRLSRSQG